MTSSKHPTWIEIDLSVIKNNIRFVKERTKTEVLTVVKNNAYGHGAVQASKAALQGSSKWLAVARLNELIELRQAGITAPVLIFGGVTAQEAEEAVFYDATLPAFDPELLKAYSAAAQKAGKSLKLHLKVETGMGRFGIFPWETLEFTRFLQGLPGLELDGIYSHYANVGDGTPPETRQQLNYFKQALTSLQENGISPRWVHLSSSSVILNMPDSYFNLVRSGGITYGLGGVEDKKGQIIPGLGRAFTWKARLMSCKKFPEGWGIGYDSTYHTSEGEIIGVVPVGHGDGYRKVEGSQVLIDGQRVPIVGKLCMDQFMISLPKMYPAGTEIVLIGAQAKERITSQELARKWSLATPTTTNVNLRVPRIYLNE